MEYIFLGIVIFSAVVALCVHFLEKGEQKEYKKENRYTETETKKEKRATLVRSEPEEIPIIKPIQEEKELLPYHFKYLLTKKEWEFYKKLKITSDKYNLHILSKVRLADLVEVDNYLQGNAFNKYFSKIMAKHVDFVLCNPSNLAVRFILELDDSSHTNSATRAERDDFVDKVLRKCGYKVIHTYGNANLDEIFERIMKG